MPTAIKHELIKDSEGRIKFRKFRKGGHEHYRIAISIDEPDRVLDKIERVQIFSGAHHSERKVDAGDDLRKCSCLGVLTRGP